MTGKGKQSKFELIIGAQDRFAGVFERFGDKAKDAAEQAGKIRTAFRNVGSEAGKLLKTATFLGTGLAVALGVGGSSLSGAIKQMGTLGKAASDSASRAGMHLKTWQEYAYAASRAGISSGELETALGGLQEKAKTAFKGDGDAISLLNKIGLDPKSENGKVQAASVLLTKLADKIKALKDAGDHAGAADLAKQMGVVNMLPLLEKGGTALDAARKRAHDLGLVFDDTDAQASKSFTASLADLSAMLRGFGNSLFRVVLPPLTQLMGKFGEWANVQRKLNGNGAFANWVKSLDVDEIWAGIKNFLGMLKTLVTWVNTAARAFGGWGKVLAGIAGIMAGKLLFSLVSLGAAFVTNPLFLKGASLFLSLARASFLVAPALVNVGKALMALGGAGPWVLVTALTTAVYAIYKNWDGVVTYFRGIWQEVKAAFDAGWTKGILTALWNFNPLRLIMKGLNELVAYFTGFNLFETIGKKWREQLTAWIPGWLRGKLGLSAEGAVAQGAEGDSRDTGSGVPTPSGLLPDFSAMSDKIGNAFDSFTSGMKNFFGFGSAAGAERLNMGPDARAVSETRTEHVEKNELAIKIQAENGTMAQVSGSAGSGASLLQNGQMATMMY